MEAHDLDTDNTNCQIDEIIAAGHGRPCTTFQAAKSDRLDNADDSAGGSDTMRRWATFIVLTTCACHGDPDVRVDLTQEESSIAQIEWLGERLSLEETPEVVVVTAKITPDPLGGYLVTDPDESQVRRYDEEGRLIWFFGAKGDGPGEFSFPGASGNRVDR